MLNNLIQTYLNLYQISLIITGIMSWLALSYVDRIHMRERARRYGVIVSILIASLVSKITGKNTSGSSEPLILAQDSSISNIYDKFRLIIIRPICTILETLIGFLEGIENIEPIIIIADNKDKFNIKTSNNTETTTTSIISVPPTPSNLSCTFNTPDKKTNTMNSECQIPNESNKNKYHRITTRTVTVQDMKEGKYPDDDINEGNNNNGDNNNGDNNNGDNNNGDINNDTINQNKTDMVLKPTPRRAFNLSALPLMPTMSIIPTTTGISTVPTTTGISTVPTTTGISTIQTLPLFSVTSIDTSDSDGRFLVNNSDNSSVGKLSEGISDLDINKLDKLFENFDEKTLRISMDSIPTNSINDKNNTNKKSNINDISIENTGIVAVDDIEDSENENKSDTKNITDDNNPSENDNDSENESENESENDTKMKTIDSISHQSPNNTPTDNLSNDNSSNDNVSNDNVSNDNISKRSNISSTSNGGTERRRIPIKLARVRQNN
jgi:hypothetical protein